MKRPRVYALGSTMSSLFSVFSPRYFNLRTKLLWVLLLVSLLPLSVGASIYYTYSVSVMAAELGASSVEITKQVQGKVDSIFHQLGSMSNMLMYNPDLQYLLTLKKNQIDSKSVVVMNAVEKAFVSTNQYRQLFFLNGTNLDDFRGIFLYTDSDIFIHDIPQYEAHTDVSLHKQAWFQQIGTQPGPQLLSEHLQDYASGQRVLTFGKRLISSVDYQERATLFIDFSPALIERMLADIRMGQTGFIFMMDRQGNPVYTNERYPVNLIGDSVMSKMKESVSGSFTKSYKGQKTLISYSTSSVTGWTVVAGVPWSEIGVDLRKSFRIGLILLIIVGAAVMSVVSNAFSKVLTTSLFKLQNAMRKAEMGNYSVRIQLNSKDEFGRLGDHFNRMLQELSLLQQEVLNTRMREFQQQLHRKDSELIALRAQINPHFLYNTLNTMTCIGEVHNVQEVALLSSSLAHMFKYSISGEHFAILREEMDQINAYLAIMQIRYKDRFKINVHVPEYTLDVRLLKMMLQPIVENAFQHGLERKLNGRIDIIALMREQELIVSVVDDGAGMDGDKLVKLKKLLDPNHLSEKLATSHIGLYNVQKRLQLHYEGKAYLDIASEIDRGTVVTIHIPYRQELRKEEFPDVSTDDRG